jgi:DNA-binding NarL/FixJ family response regulator
VQSIQRYYHGLLYVPCSELPADRRRVITLNLAMKGCSTTEIAKMLRISPRRVRQILAEERRLSASTAQQVASCDLTDFDNAVDPGENGLSHWRNK